MEDDSLDISQIKAQTLGFQHETRLRAHSHRAATTTRIATQDRSSSLRTQPEADGHDYAQNATAPDASPQPPTSKVTRLSNSQPELLRTDKRLMTRMEGSGESQRSGTTDPLSQWVVDDFAKSRSILGPRLKNGDGVVAIAHKNADTSYGHGDSGHINLIGHFVELSQDDAHLPEAFSQDGASAEIFPESRRFQPPETPATTSKKRDIRGNVVEHVFTTPALPINPFSDPVNKDAAIMGLSQVFRATQVASSPQANVLPSDGVSERPSPHLFSVQRPSTSCTLSSPAKLPRMDLRPSSAEPQVNYVSMQESQADRRRRLHQMGASSPLQVRNRAPSISDDDFGPESDQVVRHHRRKIIVKMGMDELSGGKQTGGSVVSPGPRARFKSQKRSQSKIHRANQSKRDTVLISDDVMVEEKGVEDSDEETEREEAEELELESSDELGEDNKENIEVQRVQVPNTIGRPRRKIYATRSAQTSPILVPQLQAPARDSEVDEFVDLPPLAASSPKSVRQSQDELVAIADSQVSQDLPSKVSTKAPLKSGGLTSSGSSKKVIPQSQFSKLPRTSQIDPSVAQGILDSYGRAAISPPLSSSTSTALHTSKLSQLEGQSRDHGKLSSSAPAATKLHRNGDIRSSSSPVLTKDIGSAVKESTVAYSTIPETVSVMKANKSVSQLHTRLDVQQEREASSLTEAHSVKRPSWPEISHASTQFATAPSHMSASPRKSIRLAASQNSSHSPLIGKRRSLREIADRSSPAEASVDVDIALISNDDKAYQAQMQVVEGSSPIGPSRKRRRVRSQQLSAASIQQALHLDSAPTSSALSSLVSAVSSQRDDLDKSPLTQQITSDSTTTMISPPSKVRRSGSTPKPNDLLPAVAILSSDSESKPEPENVPSPLIAAPNRVIAYFNGIGANYYPATCVDLATGEPGKLKIRFDDGTCGMVPCHMVKRLELKPDDVVKIDRKGLRGNNYRIVQSGRKDTTAGVDVRKAKPVDHPLTDVYGNRDITVVICSKNAVVEEHDSFDLAEMYMTTTQFSALKDREFAYQAPRASANCGSETPTNHASTPATPSTRNRRITLTNNLETNLVEIGAARGPGLFSNMAFAITAITIQSVRLKTEQGITNSGGKILGDGFNELFTVPEAPTTHSSKSSGSPGPEQVGFDLKAEHVATGFVALITDNHCRQAKYFQALALGIPCLATRWIHDCVDSKRVLPWQPYLLAAGQSSFLDGAVKSRSLPAFKGPGTTLREMISARPQWLKGRNVLLILSKATEGRMKPQQFLAYALGAKRVTSASDMTAARKILLESAATPEDHYSWICYHESERKDLERLSHERVERMLFDDAGSTKRQSKAKDVVYKGDTKVVIAEFVMQSLIQGCLIERD